MQRIQEQAFAAIVACGEQYVAEERARREGQQQQQYGPHEADEWEDLARSSPWASVEGSASSLPLPLPLTAGRPPLGARLYVQSATQRALPVVAEELAHWTPATRRHSAQLLRVLILFHERGVLPHLHLLVPAIVKALQVEEQERRGGDAGPGGADGEAAGPVLVECAALVGQLVQGIPGVATHPGEPDDNNNNNNNEETFSQVVDGLLMSQGHGVEASAARQRAVAAVRKAMGVGMGSG